jgi:Tfp pilus assembly protein FimT
MKPHNINGLTLIESLICLTILIIALFFSLPSNTLLIEKNQVHGVETDIKNAIRYAKMQALISNEPLMLAPLSGLNDWSFGMQLSSVNRHHQEKTILYTWHWRYKNLQVVWQGFQSPNYLRFSNDLKHSTTNGYFLINNQHFKSKLVINRFARVRISAI